MKIAVFGATGMIGKPVVQRLIHDGYELKVLVRKGNENCVPQNCDVIVGDLKHLKDVQKTIEGCDVIYLNLSVAQSSREKDFQPERDGIRNILTACKNENIKCIAYLSSLVQNYQGMNGFDWWAFRIKNEAVRLITEHPIPSIIFKPSTFMENFDKGSYRQGNNIILAGTSEYPMHFIASADYAKMVSNAIKLFDGRNTEYIIHGPDAYSADEAARIFVENYKKVKMKIIKLPFWMLNLFGKFTPALNYGAKIVEALNQYPEQKNGAEYWDKLGKPELTLQNYARDK